MSEPFTAGIVAIVGIWLVAFMTAPWLGRNSRIECADVGVGEQQYVGAVRIRATINVLVMLVCGASLAMLAPALGVDPLLGGALGLALAVPIAYGALVLANRTIWAGFNDTFLAVRRRRRERLAGGDR